MAITWTKAWAGTDDGTILDGVDLKNIQDDLSNVLQTSDIGVSVQAYASGNTHVYWENEIVAYENDTVFVT